MTVQLCPLLSDCRKKICFSKDCQTSPVCPSGNRYEGWNFNSGNYLFTTYKIDTCFEILLFFNVVTSIVYNPLPAMWKS